MAIGVIIAIAIVCTRKSTEEIEVYQTIISRGVYNVKSEVIRKLQEIL
jgi:hypothetical protein